MPTSQTDNLDSRDLIEVSRELVLDGPLTIREIDQIQSRLGEALSARDQLVVDCGSATEADLSFVQLLIAARRSAEGCGARLTVAQPPGAALAAALARGGFLHPDGRPTGADAAWLIGMDMP